MANSSIVGHVPDIHHPEIMRGVLERVLPIGEVHDSLAVGSTLAESGAAARTPSAGPLM